MNRYYLALTIFIFLSFSNSAFTQESAKNTDMETTDDTQKKGDTEKTETTESLCTQETLSLESIKQAFKEAMQEMRNQKQKEEEKISLELKEKIKIAIEEWITAAKREKEAKSNKLLHRNWEELGKLVLPIKFPIPNDYYLRNYAYIINNSDVYKTESVLAIYKADIRLTEKLYIEKDHSSNATSIEPFLYTATRPILIKFEYNHDRFTITEIEYGKIMLRRGWPKKVREKQKLGSWK